MVELVEVVMSCLLLERIPSVLDYALVQSFPDFVAPGGHHGSEAAPTLQKKIERLLQSSPYTAGLVVQKSRALVYAGAVASEGRLFVRWNEGDYQFDPFLEEGDVMVDGVTFDVENDEAAGVVAKKDQNRDLEKCTVPLASRGCDEWENRNADAVDVAAAGAQFHPNHLPEDSWPFVANQALNSMWRMKNHNLKSYCSLAANPFHFLPVDHQRRIDLPAACGKM